MGDPKPETRNCGQCGAPFKAAWRRKNNYYVIDALCPGCRAAFDAEMARALGENP